MTDSLLAEVWAWVKGAAIIYGIVAAIVFVLVLFFIIRIFRSVMKDF